MKSSPIVISALLSMAMAIRMHDDEDFSQISHVLMTSNADIGVDGYQDSSDSYNDREIPVPTLAQTYTFENRDIIDEDGDGVEDNQKKTQGELDRFRKKVFDPIQEIHNTHNGEYPGHVRAGDSPMPAAPTSPPTSEVQATQIKSPVVKAPIPEAKPAIPEAKTAIPEAKPVIPEAKPVIPEAKPTISEVKPPINAGVLTQANEESKMDDVLQNTEPIELTMFAEDAEYLQLSSNSNDQFSFFVNNIQSPEDLQFLQTQKTRKAWKRRMLDEDGDGIEDVIKFSHDDLDEFYEPLVFGVAEDINNTHHGNLPGHKQLEFTLNNGEPTTHWFENVNGDFASAGAL